MLPPANYVIKENDHLMIIGSNEYVDRIIKLLWFF